MGLEANLSKQLVYAVIVSIVGVIIYGSIYPSLNNAVKVATATGYSNIVPLLILTPFIVVIRLFSVNKS